MPVKKINNVEINYQIDGDLSKQIIMFSNSLASNLNMWNPQIDYLVSLGYGILRYDSRGHGKSDSPLGPYSIEMLADDAGGLLAALGLPPVHFCGLSKGGMVAQMMGVRHAEKIKSLTIADSAAFMPAKDVWDARISAVTEGGMEAVVDGSSDG